MEKKIRPAAVPLITVDPFFSIWSCADKLNDEVTKNWTEHPNPLLAGIIVYGRFYSMACTDVDFVQCRNKMRQKDLKVSPLSTVYSFENDFAKVKLTFTTPLLLDRLDILARPVSYVAYEIERKCKDDVKIEFVFGISSRCCVLNASEQVEFKKTEYSLAVGNTVQVPLARSGDLTLIDWGYLHLCETDAFAASVTDGGVINELNPCRTYSPYTEQPYLAIRRTALSGVITLAYDEIKPIEYFNRPLDEYFTKYFADFGSMVKAAKSDYAEIKAMCDKFDASLAAECAPFGDDYATILALAYRQAISAHKLVADENGDILFLSKECESNGCIGTLDVTYPSIPLFLKYAPELVEGMLRPIIRYAKTDAWEFEFTPHDVGRYPLANGQRYGLVGPLSYTYEGRLSKQMPVEECGNMLICLAAVAKYKGETPALFTDDIALMKQWADYLVKFGYDPGDQLCTDDFAGHLNHNCNLSLKAILGIACYGLLAKDESYINIAREYAAKWEVDAAADHGATRLVFDNADGWSLKYNIVWDDLLGFKLFGDEMKKKEIAHYLSKLNRYGVPLDSRSDYTKVDWLMWSTCIYKNEEYFNKVCESIVNMINETEDRVPLTDWYYTSTAYHHHFQNRTVVGGLFINLLK